jgi:hypothetical protein
MECTLLWGRHTSIPGDDTPERWDATSPARPVAVMKVLIELGVSDLGGFDDDRG